MTKIIPTVILGNGVRFHRPEAVELENLHIDDPAIKAMTDLKKVPARIIYPNENIDAANEKMIANNVRMLFVVNYSDQIVGIITAQDILGEKPLRYAQENNIKRSDILVRDIMIPANEIEVIEIKSLATATVKDVIETLKTKKRQHLLVVDYKLPEHIKMVRGIFSLNQIARQLGIPVKSFDVDNTLAEIAKILQAR